MCFDERGKKLSGNGLLITRDSGTWRVFGFLGGGKGYKFMTV